MYDALAVHNFPRLLLKIRAGSRCLARKSIGVSTMCAVECRAAPYQSDFKKIRAGFEYWRGFFGRSCDWRATSADFERVSPLYVRMEAVLHGDLASPSNSA
ncbi:MAG: hypothetical protein HC933_01390 [Pleurocapsa sp. SU_196_0]|nr:hypothetical protein [Pleurocapsa sp. SU_196_0]